ncbi:hypothetical protein [Methylobacterium radiodurans]|nr:hypothetical protein [Methylobacterium radiodurans]
MSAAGFAGHRPGRRTPDLAEGCGGARVIDFAICLILAVTVVGLLLAAL